MVVQNGFVPKAPPESCSPAVTGIEMTSLPLTPVPSKLNISMEFFVIGAMACATRHKGQTTKLHFLYLFHKTSKINLPSSHTQHRQRLLKWRSEEPSLLS